MNRQEITEKWQTTVPLSFRTQIVVLFGVFLLLAAFQGLMEYMHPERMIEVYGLENVSTSYMKGTATIGLGAAFFLATSTGYYYSEEEEFTPRFFAAAFVLSLIGFFLGAILAFIPLIIASAVGVLITADWERLKREFL